MDDIRLFIKKIVPKDSIKLSIKYNDNYNTYKYKYYDNLLIFNEYFPIDYEEDNKIELIIGKNKYDNYNDIQLILFELFDYKTIEYIDIYLQKKVIKNNIYIEDIYDDYYDDINDKLICTRLLKLKDNTLSFKLKFIILNKTDIKLYYKNDIISDFDNILKKIDEIISLN
jgi:hypothetical protein